MSAAQYRFVCLGAYLWFFATVLHAQEAEPVSAESKPAIPKISDGPKTVDPTAFVPAALARATTVDFTDSSLREVVAWLREKANLVALLDNGALSEIGVLPGDPISDRLDEAPVYLLLNRLRSLGLAWYFEGEILHITSAEVAENHLATIPYTVGDLLDAGYDVESLGEVVESAVSPNSWDSVGGNGAVSFLGDVMFIRQTYDLHLEVRGLLTALRKHGRRTFTLDPPQHALLRQKLDENVSVAFRDTPLEEAVEQLANKQVDMRLDLNALREIRIRQREPMTLSLNDCKLKTVLRAMLLDLKLTWMLRDGVLWITSHEDADACFKTAVFDVRDLCRDEGESDALRDAITSQTQSSTWDNVGGDGTIQFASPGTLVVRNTENMLDEVLNLLETYRTALRMSKPRPREEEDPNEVITVYYRMHSQVANDLRTLLRELVRPDSWQNPTHPDAPGKLHLTASNPDLTDLKVKLSAGTDSPSSPQKLVMERAVLIIEQTRVAHDEIAKFIRRVESGDASKSAFGGGGGGGGFGGGFFSVSPE